MLFEHCVAAEVLPMEIAFSTRSGLLDDGSLRAIARRAATLEERIAGCPDPCGNVPSDPVAQRRRDAWREAVARGDEAAFARHLQRAGLREDSLDSILGSATPVPDAGGNGETGFYLCFLRRLGGGHWSAGDMDGCLARFPEFAQARPFIPFYLPFVHAAHAMLVEQAGEDVERAFIDALESSVVDELSQLATDPLHDAFKCFGHADVAGAAAAKDFRYRAFLDHLLNRGGAADFLREHATLARLMSHCVTSLVEVISELAGRLRRDRPAIAERLFAKASPGLSPDGLGPLTEVSRPLSDRHCGGRRVYRLTFGSGARVIYKPKDITHEEAFGRLVRRLAGDGMPHAPRTPLVLCRDGYGWVEFIRQGEVDSEAGMATYHRRAGTLLALVHLLDGNDCHMENVIATGESPVLIDVESLLQPRMPRKSSDGTFSLAAQRVRNSVLSTGLLPQWQTNSLGVYFDTSGFNGTGGYPSAQTMRSWQEPNSDALAFTERHPIAAPEANLPVLDGKPHTAAVHLDPLITGFKEACRFLIAHKKRVGDCLKGMFESPTRLIFRPSTHYGQLLRRSLASDCLKEGVDRSIALEQVFRVATPAVACPAYWPILERERSMLEQLDVPYFSMSTATRDLVMGGGIVCHGLLDQSGKERIEQRLEAFSDRHVDEQVELIRSAFVNPDHMASLAEVGKGADAIIARIDPVSREALLASAEWIANAIAANSIRGRDGFATWMAPAYLQPDPRNQRGVSYYLYSGCSGIVLFLAAVESVLRKGTFQELISSAIRPIENILASSDVDGLLEKEGIGGCSGLSSLAYALTCISRHLDDSRYLAVATELCSHITAERIRRDRSLDIVGGSAGAILSLLSLHEATGDPRILDIAIDCGRHLCDLRVEAIDGTVAWRSDPDGLLLAGFSHGTAGMALALGRLAAACGETAFLDVAWKALQYERTVFDPEERNWPAFLPQGNKRFINTWCHGAPGIALGRLGCLEVMPPEYHPGLLQELQVALDTTVDTGITQIDHLCCGNMGRIDILFTAARQLGDRRLEDIATAGATLVLQRARANKAFSLASDPQRNACFQPGFFRGISGIGYGLLRLAEPERVPSALYWKVPASIGV